MRAAGAFTAGIIPAGRSHAGEAPLLNRRGEMRPCAEPPPPPDAGRWGTPSSKRAGPRNGLPPPGGVGIGAVALATSRSRQRCTHKIL